MRKKSYGQFCPVAKASELVAERWMPLVLRELLEGSRHYGQLRRGIPLISPAMLSTRLRELVDAGVVERTPDAAGRTAYQLTEAGEELRPVIRALGIWGQRWAQRELRREQLDPELLVWVMRRRMDPAPARRAAGGAGARVPGGSAQASPLLVPGGAHRRGPLRKHPGRLVDLSVCTSVRTLTQVFLGQLDPGAAVRSGDIVLAGSRALAQSFARWCPRSRFAEHARPAAAQKS